MRARLRSALAVGLALAAVWCTVPAHAHALSGITVAPALNNVILQPDDAEKTLLISVTNNNQTTQTVKLSGLDFGTLDESGGLAFINQKVDSRQTKYGLTSWLQFDTDTLTLEPGQKKDAAVNIINKESLAPGGHYAAVVVTPVKDNTTNDRVNLVPSTSALILLRKNGGVVEDLRLVQTDVQGAGRFKFPTSVTLRFQNAGNVHLVPRGLVTVTDTLGHTLAKGIINEDSGFILPETFRKFPVALGRLEGRTWPGQYKINVTWRYDGSQATHQSVVKFYYFVNFWYLFFGIACIALICFVVLKTRPWRKVIHRGRKTPV